MGWIALIGQVLTISIKLFDLWRDKSKAKSKKKREVLEDALKGIETNNRARVTRALGRLKRMR